MTDALVLPAEGMGALDDWLERHHRVAIGGGPRTGKSTVAARCSDRPIVLTDDFSNLPWADVPKAVIAAVSSLPRFILEGVQVGRALRKGLVVDAVVWCQSQKAPRTPGQETMAKGCATIFRDWILTQPEIPILYLP